jgi:Heterokaryon incompatibility protein (HET)
MESFAYTTLPRRHIRLLKILPSESAWPRGILCDADLNALPQFNALSYAWGGDDLGSNFFDCDGKTMEVRENLFDFLQQASQKYLETPIWIDAICIDQRNDEEQNHQIQLMGEIYSKAARVLVWLGKSTPQEEVAFDFIPEIAAVLAKASLERRLLDEFANKASESGLPPLLSEVWRCLGNVLGKAWFKRLWVMQEVCLGNDIRVISGHKSVSWTTFLRFVHGLCKHAISARTLSSVGYPDVALGMSSVMSIGTLKREISLPEGHITEEYLLFILLQSIKERTASKAIDKIYGALCLMPSDVQNAMPVDVNMSEAEVYVAFAGYMIARGNASLILCQASHSNTLVALPSWCPDFSTASNTIRHFGAPTGMNDFKAGIEASPSGRERVDVVPNSNLLLVHGFEFGRISAMVDLDYTVPLDAVSTEATLKWDQACLDMLQPFFDSSKHDQMLENLNLTRVAGGRLRLHEYRWESTSELGRDYKDWTSGLKGFLHTSKQTPSAGSSRFGRALQIACLGRRLFLGIEGCMGLGSPNIQPGDLVCIFYGRPTPFVLRANADGATHRLIGEAYVNNVMDGSLLELRERHSLKDKTFVLK